MKPQGLGAGDFDLPDAMQKISAETKKRGVKIIPWMEEDNRARPAIKGMDELYEVDLHGRRTAGHPGGPCLNNPYFRNLIAAQVEDYIRSYDVDGLQRGSERQGPLGNALGAWHHGAKSDPGHTSCFCEYCAAKAAKQGIDFERVKKAFLALEPYIRDGRAGKRPRDGYYVEFWRILLRYPELLVWETFWSDSMREMQREFSAKAKSIRPGIQWVTTSGRTSPSTRFTGPSRITAPTRSMPIFSSRRFTTIRPASAWPRLWTASPRTCSAISAGSRCSISNTASWT